MASDEGDQAERQFWTALEFRVCDEMRRLPVPRKLGLWCDGFIPRAALDLTVSNVVYPPTVHRQHLCRNPT
jgi:hypothetical protein